MNGTKNRARLVGRARLEREFFQLVMDVQMCWVVSGEFFSVVRFGAEAYEGADDFAVLEDEHGRD